MVKAMTTMALEARQTMMDKTIERRYGKIQSVTMMAMLKEKKNMLMRTMMIDVKVEDNKVIDKCSTRRVNHNFKSLTFRARLYAGTVMVFLTSLMLVIGGVNAFYASGSSVVDLNSVSQLKEIRQSNKLAVIGS